VQAWNGHEVVHLAVGRLTLHYAKELEAQHQPQRVADKLDMSIHFSHFPPGITNWNKVEQFIRSVRFTARISTVLII
jgi:hypothetical protein